MMLTPAQFLFAILVFTATAAGVQFLLRRRHIARLRALAQQRHMHFSPDDRFRLTGRIVPLLPVPGAAAVRVRDLVYGVEGQTQRYVFCTEYTTGVLRTKTGIRRVARFSEPRDGSSRPDLVFADEHLPLMDQYQQMLEEKREDVK
jgi:hypothetical protein